MFSIRQLILKGLAPALLCTAAIASRPLLAQNVPGLAPVVIPTSPVSVSGALGTQSPLLGSGPTGTPTGTVIPLSLSDALDRWLKYNLGAIESDLRTRTARAERLRALSDLRPTGHATISHTAEQLDRRAQGVKITI